MNLPVPDLPVSHSVLKAEIRPAEDAIAQTPPLLSQEDGDPIDGRGSADDGLEQLLTLLPAGIGRLMGPELRWEYINQYLVRMTGRSGTLQFLGKTLEESLPGIAPNFEHLIRDVYRTGEPFAGREMKVWLRRTAIGEPEEGYFDVVYQPLRDAAGHVNGVLVHIVEATEQVMARRSRDESAERFRLAQTAAQIGTWEWDPARNTRALSPELHHMFATNDSSSSYRIWASRVHPEDWAFVLDQMTQGDRAGTMEFEYRYNHPELGVRWFCCVGRRLRDDTRMFGIVQDVTARKLAEEASHRLAAIVQSSEDAIVGLDLDGTITSWNPAASRIFGYSAEEIIGRPIYQLIPERLHSEENSILAKIRDGQPIEHYETIRLRKSGEPIDVSLSISPIRDGSRHIIGASKIVRDFSERKRMERLIIQSEKFAATGRMAATVAHEINNPLESVMNLIYLARKHSPAGGRAFSYLETAEEELERVSHIARQTLGYYRDTGSPVDVFLHDIINQVLAVYQVKLRAPGIVVDCRFSTHRSLLVRKGEILQVFSNIIANAIDSMPRGGKLLIEAEEISDSGEEGIRVTVRDDGTGIPAEHLDRIFEPFFTTKGELGTGIGLWVCKQLVEKHGGRIAVSSGTGSGQKGTTVVVFLPFRTHESAPLAEHVHDAVRKTNSNGGRS